MSRMQAALAGLLGLIGGVLAGSPYLNDGGQCVAAGGNSFACAMNEAIGPFISALAIGFCVAIAIGHALSLGYRRALAPKPAKKPRSRAAVEVDDPCLQIASWGMTPRAKERVDAARSRVGLPPRHWSKPPPGPILEFDPCLRDESRVGGVGARGKPMPTPRRLI